MIPRLYFLFLLLIVFSCSKKSPGDSPIVVDEPKKEITETISSIQFEPKEAHITVSSELLLMGVNETTTLTVYKTINNVIDSSNNNIQFTSSNPEIVSISPKGEILAKKTGSIDISIVANGKKKLTSISVVKDNLPNIEEPYFCSFINSINIVDIDKPKSINFLIRNRLGKPIKARGTLVLDNNTEPVKFENIPTNLAKVTQGLSDVHFEINGKPIPGKSKLVAISFSKPSTNIINASKPKVWHADLTFDVIPKYFTDINLKSSLTGAYVYRAVFKKNGSSYDISIFSNHEKVSVESENNTVISANGNSITSIAPGLGRWRVVIEDFRSSWYTSQVMYDFSGGWYCPDDKQGNSIRMIIPKIKPKVYSDGAKGNFIDIYKDFANVDKSVAIRAKESGKSALYKNITNSLDLKLNVDVGPNYHCIICNYPTTLLKDQDIIGAFSFLNHGKNYGDVRYLGVDNMLFLDQMSNSYIFTRNPDITSVINLPTISSVLPEVGIKGTKILIKGTNLSGTEKVKMGGVDVKSFTIENDYIIRATLGEGKPGDITVHKDGETAGYSEFTFLTPSTFKITFNGETMDFYDDQTLEAPNRINLQQSVDSWSLVLRDKQNAGIHGFEVKKDKLPSKPIQYNWSTDFIASFSHSYFNFSYGTLYISESSKYSIKGKIIGQMSHYLSNKITPITIEFIYNDRWLYNFKY